MANETKTYAITEEQRKLFCSALMGWPKKGESAKALEALQSLPLITGEPVARMMHSLKPLLTIHPDIARTYDECSENRHPDTWREGVKLYAHPQPPVTEPKGLFIDLMNEHFPNGIEAERPLQPITADDVTEEMLTEIELAWQHPNATDGTHDEFCKKAVAISYNAVIKHKGDTK